ncbi:hypothetical protein [Auraticoccus monumenti]|uniref:Uncharacterized protein n=1 Tax=Auraticoccus monumenti TaxID=675864 RepID=A0A1G7EU26_9ACTN|nr:hypothetical protein [Auraticoccus monumenti]SDE67184.1 hypothetical protein SAMN04489747_4045 [Auraticoccus monumenti]
MASPPSSTAVWGDLTADLDDATLVLRRGAEVLLRCTLRPRVSGRLLPVQHRRVDPDEIELGGHDSGLRWSVRHAFSDAWHTRVSLEVDDAPVQVQALDLEVVTDRAGWCWPSGVHGLLAVLGPDPRLLVTRAVRARLGDGAALGPLTVRPGTATVLALRTRWEGLDEVAERLPVWLPPLERPDGDPLELVHPDAGLVLPNGLTATTQDGTSEIDAVLGEWQLSLHGPEGETRLQPCWAPTAEDATAERASELLRDAPRRQGVPDVPPAAALLLGRAGRGADRDDAVDRALAADTDAPWLVLLAVEEHQRTGRAELLALAADLITRLPPGGAAPAAAMAVLLASATTGHDPAPAAAALASWSGTGDPLLDLELELLTGTVGAPGLEVARRVVQRLGAGLPGTSLQPRPAADVAREVTLLRWLPDRAAAALEDVLLPATSLAELVQRSERRLLARADVDDVALAWLGTTVGER